MNEEEKMKLEEALKTIREECRKHSDCSLCPLRMMDKKRCSVVREGNVETPDKWVLKCDDIDGDRLFR